MPRKRFHLARQLSICWWSFFRNLFLDQRCLTLEARYWRFRRNHPTNLCVGRRRSCERQSSAQVVETVTEPLLRVRGLQSGYGDVQVLWGVDLDVPENAIVSIVGSNGAGKTTLLLTLSGMVKARAGSSIFGGEDLTNRSPDKIVAAGIAHVPEGRRLFRTLSVRDNLMLGAYHRHDHGGVSQDLEFVYSIFPILKERASQDASTMSGGEQQMCAIGRGIMARPKLLIIDELSLGLAPSMIEILAESLLKIRASMSILLVEQDVATAFEISDYGYVLDTGRIALHGRSQDLLEKTAVRGAYLGM
jgi:branched-chain amino acid transport system ATP-binding protein